ncbi:MAG: SusC/RagA family TonB-linked outer membrane protein [Prevotellaceae bacterium]|nr:SusC/RagA family TonB-linked outer membrane protein [Prevotellaceae bacterium]
MKTTFQILLLLLLLPLSSAAQKTLRISGTVHDEADKPVAGVGVVVKGTTIGATTDVEGSYTISAPDNATLVFSLLGMISVEEAVAGRERIDVRMSEETQSLDEVVVTAMGIKKSEKALGYSVSKVSGEDLANAGSNNWLSSITGKVAGLNLDQSSSQGGGVRVVLRGESSLSHDKNTALFVVDGVPIISDFTPSGEGGSYDNDDAPVDFGGGAGDINPDDIETISVLKGPAATALYGSRAANGAIVVTTKSGNTTKGLGVSVNFSMSFEQPDYWPDFQEEYTAGDYRRPASGAFNSGTLTVPREYSWWSVNGVTATFSRQQWGEKIEGQMRYLYSSRNWETGEYTKVPVRNFDWFKGFFETSVTANTSVAIDYNNGRGSMLRFSVKDSRISGIVPNSDYSTQNFNLSAQQKINQWLSFSTKLTYYRKDCDNQPVAGYSNTSPLRALIQMPANVDMSDIREEYFSGRIDWVRSQGLSTYRNTINSYYDDNPYEVIYEHVNSQEKSRFYGNASLTLNIIPDKLTLMGRTGIDWGADFRTQRKPFYAKGYQTGMYREQHINPMETNNDFLLNYKETFLDDLDINASLGGNTMYSRSQRVTQTASRLFTPDVYQLQNSAGSITASNNIYTKAINSLFGFVSLGYKDTYYLEVTGRNDWSSTLARGHNSYFYPSVNTSILLDRIFDFKHSLRWVDMLKVRASWANVGNDTDPYQLEQTYSNLTFLSAYQLASKKLNPELRPENVESWEFGIDWRLFKNRIGIDLTYYSAVTTDQIIEVPTDWNTGMYSQVINAGKVTNKGVELALTLVPVKTKTFRWNANLTWSKNWNKLVELAPGVELWQLNTANTVGSQVLVYAYPDTEDRDGTELGRIYGAGYERAPKGAFYLDAQGNKVSCEGQVVVDPATGNPVLSSDLRDFGSIFPDWKAGMTHSFTYKGLTLNMNFAAQMGGHAYSVTNQKLSSWGRLTNSLEGRYTGLVHEGVNRNADGTFSPNSTITTDVVDYYASVVYYGSNVETQVFETSFFKLKEVRLDYRLPAKLMKKLFSAGSTQLLQSLSVGVYSSNVFCLTTWPQYDPEKLASLGNGSLNAGVESGSFPATRTYGFNLKVTF